MKKWATIAAVSFIVAGIAGQNEPNFVSAMAALVFLISIIVLLFKWVVGIAKKHPEWMSDDDEYVAPAPKKTTAKTPKPIPKKVKPATITKTLPGIKGYPAEKIAKNIQVKPLDSEYDDNGDPLFIVKPTVEIKICYNGMVGGKTTRTVTVQALRNGRSVYIIGWCHMYNDRREFYAPAIDKIWVNSKETTTFEFIRSLGFDKKIGRLNDFPPQMVPESERPVKRVLNKTKNTTPKKTKPAFSQYGTVSELKPFIDIGKDGGPDIWFDIKPDREIEIEYRDASGDITRRRVTAQAIETAYNTLVLKAYCHLRQSQRSFKLENIRRLYENGREVYIADWLDDIGFTNSSRVKRRVAKAKVVALVDKMDDGSLDEFIKNSTAAGV